MTKQSPDKTEPESESDRQASEASDGIGVMKERVAGVLGGALSRLFERAGLDVRVTSPATQPSAPAVAPSSALPGRDALLTLATTVLAERLLSARSAAAAPACPHVREEDAARAAAPVPRAECDRISDLLGPAVVDPTARVAPRTVAPSTVPPAATRPRAVEPATVAQASPAAPAAPPSEKHRGFTLRY